MKIRADWTQCLHNCKKREMDIIFSKCPDNLFQSTLELGAGDGFQSRLLTKYTSRLISTELDEKLLKKETDKAIEYKTCDAREIDKIFDRKEFDLIFSSNLMEHLDDPDQALRGIYETLKDDGITIHVMPNPFWKYCILLLRIPYMCILGLERVMQKGIFSDTSGIRQNNNPKAQRHRRPFLYRILVPNPHGVSNSNIEEFHAFSKSRWKRQFDKANLKLIKIIRGPVVSGYGFGLEWISGMMERLKFSSEYIYIAVKKGKSSCYEKYF